MRDSMSTRFRILAVLAGLAFAGIPARAEVILVDFGTSNSYRGVSVANPDANGRYWNGFAPGDVIASLLNSSNQASGISLTFTTGMGSDSYNGPAGPTSDPPTPAELTNTVIDAAALGALGVTNAAVDYIEATPGNKVKFTLGNLDPQKLYALTFFGSRKYPSGELAGSPPSRTTLYASTDSNGASLVSITLNVGAYGDHNSNGVVSLTDLQPDTANKLFIEFSGLTASNAGYLNSLLIESQDPPPPPTPDQTLLVDFGNSNSFGGASVVNPDANGSTWNSVDSGAYYANLVDVSNQTTAIDLGFDATAGTDSYNGPSGVVNTVSLGLLGGDTNAVNDYYVSSRFQIQGLNPFHRYTLTFFGSHKFSGNTATVYTVYSDAAYTQAVASASLNVEVPGSPWLHNTGQLAVLTNLAPQAADILYVSFAGDAGGDGYLNAMRIDVFIPELGYAEWSTNFPGFTGDRHGDDDGDGLDNLAEFALGGNPTNAAETGFEPSFSRSSAGGTSVFTYVYARRSGTTVLNYRLELTSNLVSGTWSDTGYTTAPTAGVLNADFEAVTNTVPADAGPHFLRLLIEEP